MRHNPSIERGGFVRLKTRIVFDLEDPLEKLVFAAFLRLDAVSARQLPAGCRTVSKLAEFNFIPIPSHIERRSE